MLREHRVVEELRVLRDDPDLPAQAAKVGRADVHPVDQDRPVSPGRRTAARAQQRRLAAPVRADDRDRLARLDRQVDEVERRRRHPGCTRSRRAGTRSALLTPSMRGPLRLAWIVGIRSNSSKMRSRGRSRGLEFGVDARQLADRVGDRGEERVELQQRIEAQRLARHPHAERCACLPLTPDRCPPASAS